MMWVSVNEKWTWVLTFGHDLESLPPHSDLLLIIPGNPGVADFYSEFSKHVLSDYGNELSIWIVSHYRHVPHPTIASSEVTLLEEQIEHKLMFIREKIPTTVGLWIAGHSIGSYMILRMLCALKKQGHSIQQAFFLFPTIQHMAHTPNGTKALWYRKWGLHHLVIFLAQLAQWLPLSVKKQLLTWHLGSDAAKCVVDAALNLFNSKVLKNVLYMAFNELDSVKELDTTLVNSHEDSITFYYGLTDDWCPISLAEGMRETLSDSSRVILCDSNCEHAFVLKSGEVMAQKVASLMRSTKRVLS